MSCLFYFQKRDFTNILKLFHRRCIFWYQLTENLLLPDVTPYTDLWNMISFYFYPSPQVFLLTGKQSDIAARWGEGCSCSLLQNCPTFLMLKSLKIHINLHGFYTHVHQTLEQRWAHRKVYFWWLELTWEKRGCVCKQPMTAPKIAALMCLINIGLIGFLV